MLRAEGRGDGGDHGGEDRAQVSPPQESPKGENGPGDQVGVEIVLTISDNFKMFYF